MASSVSSKRAFSQGGITISKHHNRLKGDIIEALQCVKCAICHDLLFHEPGPSSLAEEEPNEFEVEVEPGEGTDHDDAEEEGWDSLFLEEDDESMESEEIDET
jgi:hAT family C-terminal dimerisation region